MKIFGERIYVVHKVVDGTDEFNNSVYRDVQDEVDDVLVEPGSPESITESVRPDGIKVSYTLYIPSSYDGDFVDADIILSRDNKRYKIVGFPQEWTLLNIPLKWNKVVKVVMTDG